LTGERCIGISLCTMATSESHATHTAGASPADAEPKTPMWLPAVGVFLFLVAGVYLVTTRTVDPAELEAAAAQSATAAATAAPKPVPRQALTNRPSNAPGPGGTGTIRVPTGSAPILKRVVQ